MLLASKGIIPPKEWNHNPNIKNNDGLTVAMELAYNGKNIPKEWEHDPEI